MIRPRLNGIVTISMPVESVAWFLREWEVIVVVAFRPNLLSSSRSQCEFHSKKNAEPIVTSCQASGGGGHCLLPGAALVQPPVSEPVSCSVLRITAMAELNLHQLPARPTSASSFSPFRFHLRPRTTSLSWRQHWRLLARLRRALLNASFTHGSTRSVGKSVPARSVSRARPAPISASFGAPERGGDSARGAGTRGERGREGSSLGGAAGRHIRRGVCQPSR